jgi:hypothetical protein
MREVNFSIPNVNKASVGITTALYDRRALDCTSTLPLINSLNHLAYLTTSSARIRATLANKLQVVYHVGLVSLTTITLLSTQLIPSSNCQLSPEGQRFDSARRENLP